jgi:hypothetical protein
MCLLLVVIALLICGCGSSSHRVEESETTGSAQSAAHETAEAYAVLHFGHAEGSPVERAVTALVRRYVAAAAREDGPAGCPEIVPTLAHALAEDYGRAASLPYLKGGQTCASILDKFFMHFHSLYVREASGVEVQQVRLKHSGGYAVLRLAGGELRAVTVSLENGTWYLDAMADKPLR